MLVQRFRLVPFLVELRAVMDWVWTDTTLSLSNWMCVEDIYANIFIIKCSRETEKVRLLSACHWRLKLRTYNIDPTRIIFCLYVCCMYNHVFLLLSEIPPAQRPEEKEDCEIWHGRTDHILPDMHYLVPTPLHLIGQICGGRGQPSHWRHCDSKVRRLWGNKTNW